MKALGIIGLLAMAATSAQAVPVLQVGAPAGPGDSGTYADYQANTSNPTETDTAITSGSTLFAAGVYGNNVIKLGGNSAACSTGCDYSSFGYPVAFDSAGAVLLAAVPDGSLAAALASLTVNGSAAFYSSATLSGLFPNNHDPLKDAIADFLFFDIGDFLNTPNTVPDFSTETGSASGQIKTLTLGGTAGLNWIHFDLLAIETKQTGGGTNVRITTSLQNNPGSKDVTWKPTNGVPPSQIPEPGLLALMFAGFLSLLWGRARSRT